VQLLKGQRCQCVRNDTKVSADMFAVTLISESGPFSIRKAVFTLVCSEFGLHYSLSVPYYILANIKFPRLLMNFITFYMLSFFMTAYLHILLLIYTRCEVFIWDKLCQTLLVVRTQSQKNFLRQYE
jgi:hypothetical protein